MATASHSRASTYDLLREYTADGDREKDFHVEDPSYIGVTPAWALAVIRLGRPVSFSRRTFRSLGEVIEGAFMRKQEPLVIVDDCIQLNVNNSKRSHTKLLSATLKQTDVNYHSADGILDGDWILAWCWNNDEDKARVLHQIRTGQQANGFNDGLKFVGRVHNIRRKRAIVGQSGIKQVHYNLQAIGFDELDTQFFYDMALATAAAVKGEIRPFMAQLGLDFSKWAEQQQQRAGNIKDNADRLIVTLVDIILGKGISSTVNRPTERAAAAQKQLNPDAKNPGADLVPAPQANKEAPFAYLVPVSVATMLGRDVAQKSKAGVFGYADILDTLIGVQRFEAPNDESSDNSAAFYPPLDADRSTPSRKFTTVPLKGTFLPVNPSFVNKPLYELLQQFLNPAINEMYTSLRPNENGEVVPTLTVRQIPFSTESIAERPEFPLTRFLSLPRWKVAPVMVWEDDLGRSNATRINMMHVYGEAAVYAANKSITNQMVRNPPIFDKLDIMRSGIRAQMRTVNCALSDETRKDGARIWMEAMADWSFGSHLTFNGTLQCVGIQSPLSEGDNIEFEGLAYHVEEVSHTCSVDPEGHKTFKTVLALSNGMPIDQRGATADFPVYPGFLNVERKRTRMRTDTDNGPDGEVPGTVVLDDTVTFGDDDVLTSLDPGISSDNVNTEPK